MRNAPMKTLVHFAFKDKTFAPERTARKLTLCKDCTVKTRSQTDQPKPDCNGKPANAAQRNADL
jgi:hypothetical protein